MDRRGFFGVIAAAFVAPHVELPPVTHVTFDHVDYGLSFEITEAELVEDWERRLVTGRTYEWFNGSEAAWTR